VFVEIDEGQGFGGWRQPPLIEALSTMAADTTDRQFGGWRQPPLIEAEDGILVDNTTTLVRGLETAPPH